MQQEEKMKMLKKQKHNFLLPIFLFQFSFVFGQPENAKIETIEGKKCYVHFVQSGNTLYGIYKMYNVPVEEIVKANLGVEKGLQEGQRIIIPLEGPEGLQKNLALHKVEPKETLYGISKKYNTTAEELITLNPGIENGLNVGHEIKVPISTSSGSGETLKIEQKNFKVSFSDTLINHQVQKGETLYSLSKRFMVSESDLKKANSMRSDKIRPGDVLKIPIKKEKVEKVEIREVEKTPKRPKLDSALLFKKKDEYKIAFLMPLNLDNDPNLSSSISNMAAEYYMGTKLALDNLEKEGLKAKIFIYDTKNDSSSMEGILKKKEMNDMDLVVGPFFGTSAELVSTWCQEKGIRMFCPFSTNYEIMEKNPYVYETVASDITLSEGLAHYLLKTTPTSRIILVKTKNEEDIKMSNAFRKEFTSNPKGAKLKIYEADLDNFQTFITENSTLVFLSNTKASIRTFFNSLNRNSAKVDLEKLSVFTNKEAAQLEDLPTKSKSKINLHFVTPHDFSYENESFKNIHREYRKVFNSDMTKMAVQGYDIMSYLGGTILLQNKNKNFIMNKFVFEEKGLGNGFENKNGYIMKYQDFEIVTIGNLYD